MPGICLALLLALAPAPSDQVPGKWHRDRIWYDGLAEVCTYRATRTVYGKERRFVARAYTNKERVDPRTGVKTEDEDALIAFKHHWSETVPTERYDYRYSTMSYVRADLLTPFKLTASGQDDCGASFKEAWRDEDRLVWTESVYFPGGGRRAGEVEFRAATYFSDALPLSLRNYPFDHPKDLRVRVVPSQKDVHRVPFEPQPRVVRYAGRAVESLPIGEVDVHALELVKPDGTVEARFGFFADETPPRLRAMVRYEGPEGTTYRLESIERTAYWHR